MKPILRTIPITAALMVLLAPPAPAAAAPHLHPPAAVAPGEPVDLAPLREIYLASVRDSRAIGRGMDEIARLRAGGVQPGTPLDATLTAYQGALLTLRARHAAWPPQKLRYLREGLALLDATVTAQPENAEVRYVRLMSCYYLPGLFGRGGSVRQDFAALARLLPGVRAQYPRPLYDAIVRFVVEHGRLTAEQRGTLEASLRPDDA